MRILRTAAEGIGWAVIVFWALGVIGVLDVAIHVGPPGQIIKKEPRNG